MFENSEISWFLYIIIVVAAIIVLILSGLYLVWNYHLGKPMAPFFWLRIKGWTTRNIALFEIFSLTNSISLEEARKEKGDGYRLFTPTIVVTSVPKKVGKFKKIYNRLFAKNIKPTQTEYVSEKVKRVQTLIMPKSTYSINGVNTIPLWDLHPPLHPDLTEGVRILVENGITTLKDLEEFIIERE